VKPIPGDGIPVTGDCYQGLCWAPPKEGGDIVFLAFHPDGKRAAVLRGREISLYDMATKKATASFPLNRGDTLNENEVFNSPNGLWFVGESVFVLGVDAGPAQAVFAYDLAGKATSSHWGLYNGGATASGDRLIFEENGLSKIFFLGVTVTSMERHVPKGPCKAGDEAEWSEMREDDSGSKACANYIRKTFAPYRGAQLVADGKDLVGFAPATGVFVLDAKTLVQKSSAKVAICPKPAP
jgi:hypothetical protein